MQSKASLSWLSAENNLGNPIRSWMITLFTGVCMAMPWVLSSSSTILLGIALQFMILQWQAYPIGIAKRGQYWRQLYLSLLLFNGLATWWIWHSTAAGAIAAIVLNAALMSLPVLASRWIGKKLGNSWGLLSLPLTWISFEYAHMNWELTWSWLNLGNMAAFGFFPNNRPSDLAELYPFFGSQVGTLYCWMVALSMFSNIKKPNQPFSYTRFGVFVLLIIGPMVLRYALPDSSHSQGKGNPRKAEVVVIQPNINPYTEKFADSPDFIPVEKQIARMIHLSDSLITSKTQFVLWPETALPTAIAEETIDQDPSIVYLRNWLRRYPQVMLITGATTTRRYTKDAKTATARYYQPEDCYFDVFNTAVGLQTNQPTQLYRKSKLVPGVERLPYPWLLGWLSESVFNLGGTAGSLGDQPHRAVFAHASGVKVAPVICYESAYGDFVQSYMPLKPDFIAIITNDAWWGNTQGHIHHWDYAKLRAIEQNLSIARSANTGLSGFIEPNGQPKNGILDYGTQGALRQTITLGSGTPTLYGQIGNGLAWLALIGTLLLIVKAWRA